MYPPFEALVLLGQDREVIEHRPELLGREVDALAGGAEDAFLVRVEDADSDASLTLELGRANEDRVLPFRDREEVLDWEFGGLRHGGSFEAFIDSP